MRATFGWVVIVTLGAIGGAAVWWQRVAAAELRRDVAMFEDQALEAARLRSEQARLRALQISDEALSALRADRAAVAKLREEINGLEARARESAAAAKALPAKPERFAVGEAIAVSDCKNAGSATPAAVLETALWASAGGDVDALARLLTFDDKARVAAKELAERMPESVRAQYATPERLMAFLSIKDVPLGTAQVSGWNPGERMAMGSVLLTATDGKQKHVNLPFVKTENGWRVFVLENAVAKYLPAPDPGR